MSKLNIFVDGSWLYKVCQTDGVLARKTVYPRYFKFDFSKFRNLILKYIQNINPECDGIDECHFVTSLFDLPSDFTSWVGRNVQGRLISQDNIDITKANVQDRTSFANGRFICRVQSKFDSKS
jgi:hypothetical protein